jgi:hypothetical protein
MAITGTKVKTNTSNKNWFINHCRIVEAEQIDSQYNDCSIRMKYEDVDSGYNYTAFINQNFEKDNNGIVTGLKYPDDVNTLYLAANADLNVSDVGQVNVEKLIGKEVAVLNYKSTGKYKNATWGVVSSLDNTDELGKRFMDQVAKGYPKNYMKPTPEVLEAKSGDTLDNGMKVDDLPF